MLPVEEHEGKCKRCGECCRIKLLTIPGRAVALTRYCKHWDRKTKRCSVYDRRHEVTEHCSNVAHMIRIRALPNSCGYVEDVPGYKSRVDWPTDGGDT